MALINCPECGGSISDTSRNCIHCGYALQNIPDYLERSAAKNNKRERKKTTTLIVAVCGFVALIVVGILFYFDSTRNDPFHDLYIGQTRESVRKAYGEPSFISDEDPNEKYSWNSDLYNAVKLLNITGTLYISYDSDNLVTGARFSYTYPIDLNNLSKKPSSKDRDEAQEYVLAIIEYYTGKHGSPYDNEWHLADGSTISLEVNLDEYSPDTILLRWH